MNPQTAFDYAKPFDILVGHWVGTASIYDPKGTYLISTKSYVSVFWQEDGDLGFRESGEDAMEFSEQPDQSEEFVNPRSEEGVKRIVSLLSGDCGRKKRVVARSSTLRDLTYDFAVVGSHCATKPIKGGLISVTGRQTRPDAYQFHVKKTKFKPDPTDPNKTIEYFHHVYNSHHLPTPNDWHINGPIVGPIQTKNKKGETITVEGEIGLSIAQSFKRISYYVPEWLVREIS
jgi:hypothetical protein